ncbi:DUF413 domain-containing protein [Vibrio sp. ZSDZ34]|jgi:uncharacterized protein YifE (UPF0438 family)|uniref:Macrodomain Ori protein n=1 Tax=Vibrio gelatinilyticus TaxID=2893468 RepID=A0A9X1WBB8_9VIBR|nr:DUF413 domain-containing protein [Vibrio gelatinilyticus]MCJ2377191.1 DUF413 domain-containing protein [Vibrio gelatinilyticus]
MTETQFRHGKKRFFDIVKFPRGFAKSGDFTLLEEQILITFGETMLALENGEIVADNADEKHFVKVLKHPGKAKTKLEHVWLKYIRLARGRKSFHTLNSRSKFQMPIIDFDYELNEDNAPEAA